MTTRGHAERAPLALVIAAFAAIYIIWGSTYLAIRIGVETIPPFLMAGFRSLVAGGLMFAFVYARGSQRPTWAQWRSAAVVGGLLLLGGNGLVTWAEKTVPSGVAALLITTVPIWLVLLNWVRRDGARPTLAEGLGVGLGFAGVAMLIGSDDMGDGAPVHRLGALALILAALSWSLGSLHARRASLPKSPLLTTSMEMLCGGALLTLVGLALGETGQLSSTTISTASLLALAYLITFGSLVGFTAYSWLLRVTTPARIGTYAFVNPMVAVVLGCTIGGEPFSYRFVVASGIIIVAVIIIIAYRARPKAVEAQAAAEQASAPPPIEPADVSDGSVRLSQPAEHGRSFSIDQLLGEQRESGRPYHEFLRSDAMSLGVYALAAGAEDRQSPHGEDEAYYVLGGKAAFRLDGRVQPVAPGDVLYVPAHVPHRFEDIREDLTVLVFFAPAEYGSGRRPADTLPDRIQLSPAYRICRA